MITYKNGDLLESGCDIICHQVNLQGIMGGGLAKQIANKYPDCEFSYKAFLEYCKNENIQALGKILVHYNYKDDKFIVNCFTQKENFDTDYEQVRKCFTDIKEYAIENNLLVGFPYNYGSGIANGDWNIVEQIIKDIFEDDKIDCQIWRL